MNTKQASIPETKAGPASALQPGRYAIGTLLVSAWIMVGALHIPIDALLSESLEILAFPSFMFLMPLTLFFMSSLPWEANVLAIPDLLAFCVLDFVVGAVICLPLLFPRGRKQNGAAVFSLVLVVGYTLGSAVHFAINR